MVTRQPGDRGGEVIRREPLVWTAAPSHRPDLVDPLPLALFPEECIFRPLALSALDGARRS